ncbi:AAA family ATPase [Cupriavidus sp. 2KB_3]|uniref:bifunctional aminoglycoside phosphotransferase/ATP-binding protein n=1 Tax=Cupriavidus sp. 2KB_3 TaxID=3232980 RepID=UPI003F91BCAA
MGDLTLAKGPHAPSAPVDAKGVEDPSNFVRAMCDATAYPDKAWDVTLIETHISQVFLAGDFAYKVRKPVRLDFVDFSSLDARRMDCEEEVRLNRRMAPELYLGVVPIVAGAGGSVRVDRSASPIEYAVKMRRFDQRDVFSVMAQEGRLTLAHMDALATTICAFHHQADVARESTPYGTPGVILQTVQNCADAVVAMTAGAPVATRVRNGLCERARALSPVFAARRRHNHVRECHGDLHLGNIVLLNGLPTPFDCLEFDPMLRWTDTASDIAFAYMDLIALGHPSLAHHLINAYLARSGDFGALRVLPFYASLRALVRARIDLERAQQARHELAERPTASPSAWSRLTLAETLLNPPAPRLVLMHGLSGSGKSTVARNLADAIGAIWVRSDVERKRLRRTPDHYTPEAIEATYRRLRAICRIGLAAGFTMIADATFLLAAQRRPCMALAQRLGVPVTIVHCEARADELAARIRGRARLGDDPSEANLAVLASQQRSEDALSRVEMALVVPSEHCVAALMPRQTT